MIQEMTLSIPQLENLLKEQKKMVIEYLLGQTSYYNASNTPGQMSSLAIDKEKFTDAGMARYIKTS